MKAASKATRPQRATFHAFAMLNGSSCNAIESLANVTPAVPKSFTKNMIRNISTISGYVRNWM